MGDVLRVLLREFRQASTWKRLLALSMGFLALLGILFVYEWYTARGQLDRLKTSTEILTSLNSVRVQGADRDPLLHNSYERLARELEALSTSGYMRSQVPANATLLKFVAGSAPWWILGALFAFIAAITSLKDGFFQAVGFGVLLAGVAGAVGCLPGFVGTLVPAIGWPWLNLVIYPVFTVVAVVGALVWTLVENERREAAAKEVENPPTASAIEQTAGRVSHQDGTETDNA